MAEEPDNLDPELEDLGAPVTELQLLADPVPESFLGRIQRTIRRRELAADVTRFSLWTPALVFLEYLAAFFSAFGSTSTPDPDRQETE